MQISHTFAALAIAVGVCVTPAVAEASRSFTYYPGFAVRGAVVEAATDKGLIVEMIVRCGGNPGIVTYSKAERLYCTPDHQCGGSLRVSIERLCR